MEIVQKYGGESIATPERMEKVAESVAGLIRDGNRVAVVVSAMGDETERLTQLAKKFFNGEPPKDELDNLLATGEQRSAALLAIMMRRIGIEAISLSGSQIGLEASPEGKVKRIRGIASIDDLLDKEKTPIITGFQGRIEGTDRVITLGPGGSDLTAIALAAGLSVDICYLYKDVDGIYAINPKIVPTAKRFDTITYNQIGQLAIAGAEVIMHRAVALAQNLGVGIRVLLSPSIGLTTGGTLICSGSTIEDMESFFSQPAIAIQKRFLIKVSNISNVPGALAAIFLPLGKAGINIGDCIQEAGEETAAINILCFPDDRQSILHVLEEVKREGLAGEIAVSEFPNMVQLTLVSPEMVERPGYLARMFSPLGRENVNIEAQGSGGNTIWVVIDDVNLKRAAKALGEEFNLILQ